MRTNIQCQITDLCKAIVLSDPCLFLEIVKSLFIVISLENERILCNGEHGEHNIGSCLFSTESSDSADANMTN